MFPLLLGQTSEKDWGGWARGSKRSIFLTTANNGFHIKFSRILPCMLCSALLCKGVLSKDFEYVPLQQKLSYRFRDLARDSTDLIFGHCKALCALKEVLQLPGFVRSVHLNMLQVSGFLCSVYLEVLQFPGFLCSVLRSAAISKILKWTFRPTSGHGNLLWPLLLGFWVRPIQKGFCSWGAIWQRDRTQAQTDVRGGRARG